MTEDKALEKLKTALEKNNQNKALSQLKSLTSRRSFLGAAGAAALLESSQAWQGLFGRGLLPIAWAEASQKVYPGKEGMQVHNLRPVNGEFAPHMLADSITPTNRHFVRNNGLIPPKAMEMDASDWSLTIEGEVEKPLRLNLKELKKLESVTGAYLVECGGNGRALFDPPVRGNQWERGAVSCSEWTGVPLSLLLKMAGLKKTAVYTAHYGEDIPLGRAKPFSRGIPIEKALMEHTIVAYKMNGKDIPPAHGFPVRLIVPGWIGSCSQKWLNRIVVRDRVHDAKKMVGYSYRVPKYQVAPGVRPPKEDMEIATSWVVKSLVTAPAASSQVGVGEKVLVRGHAWAGEKKVARVLISLDYGVTWQEASLKDPPNKYAWYDFSSETSFSKKGYYEIWARAFDQDGEAQPFLQPWNPKGYLGNVIHRVPIYVGIAKDA